MGCLGTTPGRLHRGLNGVPLQARPERPAEGCENKSHTCPGKNAVLSKLGCLSSTSLSSAEIPRVTRGISAGRNELRRAMPNIVSTDAQIRFALCGSVGLFGSHPLRSPRRPRGRISAPRTGPPCSSGLRKHHGDRGVPARLEAKRCSQTLFLKSGGPPPPHSSPRVAHRLSRLLS